MKLRNNKKHRNDRLSKQKLREWKIQMNVVGRPTGAYDVDGNEIKIGDEVLVSYQRLKSLACNCPVVCES